MEITFDPAKDAANLHKHGVSLGEAAGLEWDSALTWPDERKDYGEARMGGIAYIGLRLYCVVFVDRADVRRIISLPQGQPQRGTTLCRNLSRERFFPLRRKTPPSRRPPRQTPTRCL